MKLNAKAEKRRRGREYRSAKKRDFEAQTLRNLENGGEEDFFVRLVFGPTSVLLISMIILV